MRVNGKINVKRLREKMPPQVTLDSFILQYCDSDLKFGFQSIDKKWQFVSI